MGGYTLDLAKRDFSLGYIVSFEIHRQPLDKTGWLVMLSDGRNSGPIRDARSRQPRVFKSLDSAVSAIEQVGFSVDLLRR